MEKIVDTRGFSCPHPVIMTKKALDDKQAENITTIVDNKVALENVIRMVKSQGYDLNVEDKGGDYFIHIIKGAQDSNIPLNKPDEIAVLISSNLFGEGSEELGSVLMRSFLYSLTQLEGKVKTIIFMNSAVFLTTEGSEVLDHLKTMEEDGVQLLSCGTCLDYYQLKDRLKVGKVTNMYSATEVLTNADKVIKI